MNYKIRGHILKKENNNLKFENILINHTISIIQTLSNLDILLNLNGMVIIDNKKLYIHIK